MASEYSWQKDYIFDHIYFDELYFLCEQIKKRQIAEYKMQLAIAQNPHIDAKEQGRLWELLDSDDSLPRDDTFSKEDADKLKALFSASPHFVIKE